MKQLQEDIAEISEFYSWIRDYWDALSKSREGHSTRVLNFGYWRSSCEDLHQAQMAFFDLLFESLGQLDEGATGAEIGCGIGGYAVRLLRQHPVKLICFDLLDLHLQFTRDYARQQHVADRLKTMQGNSMNLRGFKPDELDFVYCVESSFHYDEKQRFFDGVRRIMKPGAVFVFADISCEDNSRVSFRSGNHFSSKGELARLVERTHFKILEHRDIGDRVYAPLHRFIKAFNGRSFPGGAAGQRKPKVARYWELVLHNYAQLNRQGAMGYQIYKLQK